MRGDHVEKVFPAVTSFSHTDKFPENQIIQGFRNDAAYAVGDASVDFIEWLGGLVITHLIHF